MNDKPKRVNGRFVKGQSGNPSGKPKGVKNAITKSNAGIYKDFMDGQLGPAMEALEEVRQRDAAGYIKCLNLLGFSKYLTKVVEEDQGGGRQVTGFIITQVLPDHKIEKEDTQESDNSESDS